MLRMILEAVRPLVAGPGDAEGRRYSGAVLCGNAAILDELAAALVARGTSVGRLDAGTHAAETDGGDRSDRLAPGKTDDAPAAADLVVVASTGVETFDAFVRILENTDDAAHAQRAVTVLLLAPTVLGPCEPRAAAARAAAVCYARTARTAAREREVELFTVHLGTLAGHRADAETLLAAIDVARAAGLSEIALPPGSGLAAALATWLPEPALALMRTIFGPGFAGLEQRSAVAPRASDDTRQRRGPAEHTATDAGSQRRTRAQSESPRAPTSGDEPTDTDAQASPLTEASGEEVGMSGNAAAVRRAAERAAEAARSLGLPAAARVAAEPRAPADETG